MRKKSRNDSGHRVQSQTPGRRSRLNRIMRPRVFSRLQRMLRFAGRFSIVMALTGGTLLLPVPQGLVPTILEIMKDD